MIALFIDDGNFRRNEELVESVYKLKKEIVAQVLADALDKNSMESATVLLYAKEHKIDESVEATVIDINQWKNTRNYD